MTQQVSQTPVIWLEIAKAAPPLLWFALAAAAAAYVLPTVRGLLPSVSHFKGGGVELRFRRAEQRLTEAARLRSNRTGSILRELPLVLERAKRIERLLVGASLLWVDNSPENNILEVRALRDLGITIDFAATTNGAISVLRSGEYNLVVSDMARPTDPRAGLTLIHEIGRLGGSATPVIIYLGKIEPELGTPPGVFRLADRPDELLHAIFDAIERQRSTPLTPLLT